MISDFKMITHRFDDTINVIPISDVHLGSIEHNKKAWDNFLDKLGKMPDTYILLCGDLINNSVRCSIANPFDETMRPMEQKEAMVEYLKPIKDRILCAVSGNHEARTTKESDQDLTYDIMARLGIEDRYRANMAFVKIGIGSHSKGKQGIKPNVNYIFGVTHGAGGGIMTGATVNRNERFAYSIEGLDCLVVGHTHKGAVTKPNKLVVDTSSETVLVRPMTVVSCESWLDYGGYAMRKMLLPAETCNPQMLTLWNGREKDIVVAW